ncbi:MAG: hypothetical protein LBQ66_02475 [Planctomycetaceae bacterium]|nr:hypothetical protein [Planctomycetaceae bacterium]
MVRILKKDVRYNATCVVNKVSCPRSGSLPFVAVRRLVVYLMLFILDYNFELFE